MQGFAFTKARRPIILKAYCGLIGDSEILIPIIDAGTDTSEVVIEYNNQTSIPVQSIKSLVEGENYSLDT